MALIQKQGYSQVTLKKHKYTKVYIYTQIVALFKMCLLKNVLVQ